MAFDETVFRVMSADELVSLIKEKTWTGFVDFKEDVPWLKSTSVYNYFKSFTRSLSSELYDWFIEGNKDVIVVAFDKNKLKNLRFCKLKPFSINQDPSEKGTDEFEERLYCMHKSVPVPRTDIISYVCFTEFNSDKLKDKLSNMLYSNNIEYFEYNFGQQFQ